MSAGSLSKGSGLTTPPSIMATPPISTGLKTIGRAIEAAMAGRSGPAAISTSEHP
jgi:hypothetical protein